MSKESRVSDKDACLSVHWPGKSRKGAKGKRQVQDLLQGRAMHRGFRRLLDEEEPVYLLERRRRLLEATWKKMERRMLQVAEEQDGHSIARIIHFIQSTHPPAPQLEKENSQEDGSWPTPPTSQLPLGLIHTGVNTPDHARRFLAIRSELTLHHQAKVVTIYPRDGSNLRTILQRIVEGFTSPEDGDMDPGSTPFDLEEEVDGDDEEDTTYTLFSTTDSNNTRKMSRLAPYDLRAMEAWYHSPSRHPQTRHLVIILRDFEGFSPMILEDLIMILSGYAERLPLVLLASAATSFSALSRALSRAALGLVRVAWLQLESSAKGVDTLVNSFLGSQDAPFLLGHRTFSQIFDSFIASDRSVRTVAQSFKLAMMDFYYSNPLSILMDPAMDSEGDRILSLLGEGHEEWIKSLGSFQAYIEGLIQSGSLEDRRYAHELIHGDGRALRAIVQEWLEAHKSKQRVYGVGLSLLIRLIQALEEGSHESSIKMPKGSHRRSMGEALLRGGVWEECRISYLHQHYLNDTLLTKADPSGDPRKEQEGVLERILARVRELPSTSLSTFLNDILVTLGTGKPLSGPWAEAMTQVTDGMSACNEEIRSLHDNLRDLEDQLTDAPDDKTTQPKRRGRKRKAEMLIEAHVAKGTKVLHSLEMASSRDIKGSRRDTTLEFPEGTPIEVKSYSHLVAQVRTLLKEFFNVAFSSYRELPFHEVVYYENPSFIAKSFHPHPRLAVQTALGRPWHYLSYEGTHSETVLDHTLPDTSILYRLHLECGAYINLQDWCEAFRAIARRDGEDHTEEELATRFIVAAGELEMLGYIKPTSRREDHVMRLTWAEM